MGAAACGVITTGAYVGVFESTGADKEFVSVSSTWLSPVAVPCAPADDGCVCCVFVGHRAGPLPCSLSDGCLTLPRASWASCLKNATRFESIQMHVPLCCCALSCTQSRRPCPRPRPRQSPCWGRSHCRRGPQVQVPVLPREQPATQQQWAHQKQRKRANAQTRKRAQGKTHLRSSLHHSSPAGVFFLLCLDFLGKCVHIRFQPGVHGGKAADAHRVQAHPTDAAFASQTVPAKHTKKHGK